MKEKIEKLLGQRFHAQCVLVKDDSQKHSNHPEALAQGGGHFSVFVVSAQFEGKTRVERHRLVYQCVFESFPHQIHALAIKAHTPKEFETIQF